MDATMTTWIIIIIVLVLAALVVVALVSRKGRAKIQERKHERAETIRNEAQERELSVREREAKTMEARARAEQAEVEAERLRREASDGTADLRDEREEIAEKRRQADKIDPHVDDERGRKGHDAMHRDTREGGATDARTTEQRDDSGRHRHTDPRERPI